MDKIAVNLGLKTISEFPDQNEVRRSINYFKASIRIASPALGHYFEQASGNLLDNYLQSIRGLSWSANPALDISEGAPDACDDSELHTLNWQDLHDDIRAYVSIESKKVRYAYYGGMATSDY